MSLIYTIERPHRYIRIRPTRDVVHDNAIATRFHGYGQRAREAGLVKRERALSMAEWR